MQQKTYEKYKDSGIEWIGKIPESWQIKVAKKNFSLVNGSTPESAIESYWEDGQILWATPTDLSSIENGEISNTERKITKEGYESCGTTIVNEGALILATRAPIGNVSLVKMALCFNQGCKALEKIKDIDTKYVYYYLKSYEDVLISRGKGTTFMELSTKELANFDILIPTKSEQQKISNYLDDKTLKIDKVVKNKIAQIDLLKEYEQIAINEAVIRGIDPNTKLKDSGIEWIGKIPKTWNVGKMKYITDLKFSNVNKKREIGEREVLACNYIDVYKNKYITSKINFMKITATEEEINKFSIKKGDILATKDSEEAEDIAIPSFVLDEFSNVVCGYHLAMIRPLNKFIPKYLFSSSRPSISELPHSML